MDWANHGLFVSLLHLLFADLEQTSTQNLRECLPVIALSSHPFTNGPTSLHSLSFGFDTETWDTECGTSYNLVCSWYRVTEHSQNVSDQYTVFRNSCSFSYSASLSPFACALQWRADGNINSIVPCFFSRARLTRHIQTLELNVQPPFTHIHNAVFTLCCRHDNWLSVTVSPWGEEIRAWCKMHIKSLLNKLTGQDHEIKKRCLMVLLFSHSHIKGSENLSKRNVPLPPQNAVNEC